MHGLKKVTQTFESPFHFLGKRKLSKLALKPEFSAHQTPIALAKLINNHDFISPRSVRPVIMG